MGSQPWNLKSGRSLPSWHASLEHPTLLLDAIAGKVFVSPVVRTFIYERTVDETSEWVKRIAQWRFNKIIPAHLDAPIAAGPAEFLAAFEFLERPTANPLPSGDMRPLNAISKLLTLTGLVPPRAAD